MSISSVEIQSLFTLNDTLINISQEVEGGEHGRHIRIHSNEVSDVHVAGVDLQRFIVISQNEE